jgi:hypothetical protein
LFALRKSESFFTVAPNLKDNLKLLFGEKYGMIFDADNPLVAEDRILQTTYSEDYRNASGINSA